MPGPRRSRLLGQSWKDGGKRSHGGENTERKRGKAEEGLRREREALQSSKKEKAWVEMVVKRGLGRKGHGLTTLSASIKAN